MSRSLIAWIACCWLVATAGCTMCANTFDECGPTANCQCAGGCGSDVRAGSILSGAALPMGDPEAMAGQALPPTEMPAGPVTQPKRSTVEAQGLPTQGWKSSKPGETPQRAP